MTTEPQGAGGAAPRGTRDHDPAWAIVGHAPLEPDELDIVRKQAAGGAEILAWEHPPIAQERFPSPDILGWLAEQGIGAQRLTDILGPKASDAIEDRVIDTIRGMGRIPLPDGTTLLASLRHAGLGLWWWAELYLYHETPLRLFLRDIEAVDALRDHALAGSGHVIAPPRDLLRVLEHRGLRCATTGTPHPAPWHRRRGIGASLLDLAKLWGSTLKALVTPHVRPPAPGAALFLTHASMWRNGQRAECPWEGYLGPLMAALDERGTDWRAVAVGPSIPYRRRTRRSALREMVRRRGASSLPAEPVGTYLRGADALRISRGHRDCLRWAARWRPHDTAFVHRGIPVGVHVARALRETLLLQLPWAIRAFHEMRSVLAREQPAAMILYAESSGRGRAALAAAHAARVPTLAVQHGILYPRYFSYEHAPGDVDGPCDGGDTCPLPTRTAVFGELARELLVSRGHHRAESVVVTGSPHFDAVVSRARAVDPRAVRERIDVPPRAALLVLATRMSALGRTFLDLASAVEAVDGLHLVVKPHPAESAEPYDEIIRSLNASHVRVLPPTANLAELLVACDALVTVDSLASSEALVLGHPVLVLNLPNHLQPLVDCGAALGAWDSSRLASQLESMLRDDATRARLREARQRYIHRFAAGADGRSVERILTHLDELLRLGAQRPAAERSR